MSCFFKVIIVFSKRSCLCAYLIIVFSKRYTSSDKAFVHYASIFSNTKGIKHVFKHSGGILAENNQREQSLGHHLCCDGTTKTNSLSTCYATFLCCIYASWLH